MCQALINLSVNFFCKYTAEIIRHLSVESIFPLTDVIFINHFTKVLSDNKIIEYYLIDKNDGYLLIAADGTKYVLVVHNDQSLLDFTNILGEYSELADQVRAIENRRCIPFLGVGEELSKVHVSKIDNFLFDAYKLKGKQQYYLYLLEYNDEF